MKQFILIAALMLASVATYAQTDAAKTADIVKLLELTNSADLGQQVLTGMIANLKTNLPDVPEAFWQELQAEINPDALQELIIPIYDRHFTHEDIKGLIAFYETPLGQRVVRKLPVVTQESMQVGATWGESIAQKAVTRLQERGY